MHTSNFNDKFSSLEDPRSQINIVHEFSSILLIGVISVICGADSWIQMARFAKSKASFLSKFLDLSHGTPSKDTFGRVFGSIDSEVFESCFFEWTKSIAKIQEEVIAVDGKTLRGAKSKGTKSCVHMVSAWACSNNLVLGQVKTHEKSNEITAIPELLDKLLIEGTTVTIDAIGTQKAIAEKIINSNADYVLAVKGNQQQLLEDIIDELNCAPSGTIDINETIDVDHGRIETRKCSVLSDFKFLEDSKKQWKGIQSIIKIESTREFKNSNKPTEHAVRYYISSLKTNAKDLLSKVRSHWAIENKLHWTLDVAFKEDQSRKRKDNAAQNFSILLKIALNILKNDKSSKMSIQTKRMEAAWNERYIAKLMNIKV